MMKNTRKIMLLAPVVIGSLIGLIAWHYTKDKVIPIVAPVKNESMDVVELGELNNLSDASTVILPAGTKIWGEWDEQGNIIHTSVNVRYEMNGKIVQEQWNVVPSTKKQPLQLTQSTGLTVIQKSKGE